MLRWKQCLFSFLLIYSFIYCFNNQKSASRFQNTEVTILKSALLRMLRICIKKRYWINLLIVLFYLHKLRIFFVIMHLKFDFLFFQYFGPGNNEAEVNSKKTILSTLKLYLDSELYRTYSMSHYFFSCNGFLCFFHIIFIWRPQVNEYIVIILTRFFTFALQSCNETSKMMMIIYVREIWYHSLQQRTHRMIKHD